MRTSVREGLSAAHYRRTPDTTNIHLSKHQIRNERVRSRRRLGNEL
jgi:hypothetical protein